jgi:hypothetical protein
MSATAVGSNPMAAGATVARVVQVTPSGEAAQVTIPPDSLIRHQRCAVAE